MSGDTTRMTAGLDAFRIDIAKKDYEVWVRLWSLDRELADQFIAELLDRGEATRS